MVKIVQPKKNYLYKNIYFLKILKNRNSHMTKIKPKLTKIGTMNFDKINIYIYSIKVFLI